MGGPISAKELARLRAGFLASPLTASEIPEGSIDPSKLTTEYAPASSIPELNSTIAALNVRLTAEEAVTASLATVATSGLYADLTGTPTPRLLGVEQYTWTGAEAAPFTHTLAHPAVDDLAAVLDTMVVSAATYTISGADVIYTAGLPAGGTVTTYFYMYEEGT